jgi:hypothetical protein
MRRYVFALVAGALIVPSLYLATLALMDRAGMLPPPQFSNSICIDEKLASMRRAPPQDPNFLVAGSSVAWRHFNSPAAIAGQPGLAPYNAGFCGANIRQTRAVVDWLTGRLPSINGVLLIASPVDFEFCDDLLTDGLFPRGFSVTDADRFVFEDTPLLAYYLRYFDPGTLWRNSRNIAARRSDSTTYDALLIDDYGDGPLDPPADRELLYGLPELDASCFEELRRLALSLQDQSIDFHVAMTPLHPEWLRLYDPSQQVTGRLERGIEVALAETGGHFVAPTLSIVQDAFFDAIHFRWSYTDQFTDSLVAQVKLAR